MRRDLIWAALLVALLVAVSLLKAKQPGPPQGATRSSADFRFGGYRAWYELLARERVQVTRFREHHDALAASGAGALVFAFPDQRASVWNAGTGIPSVWDAGERGALRAWIREGGRLIDVGVTPSTSRDDGRDEPLFLRQTPGDAQAALHGPWSGPVGALVARGTDRIGIKPHQGVQTLLADRAGVLVVRYRLGRGEVTAVASASLFENRVLDQAGNARLAYLVATPRTPQETVAFDEAVRGDVVDRPWYTALDVPERIALAFAALAGLLWLLYGIVPLGPPVRLRPPREPTSEEFVDAVAALYGRARARDHARDALLADARRSLERGPRTAQSRALAEQIASAQDRSLSTDPALVAVARLSRIAREETVRATNPGRRSTAPAGGARARRRRR